MLDRDQHEGACIAEFRLLRLLDRVKLSPIAPNPAQEL